MEKPSQRIVKHFIEKFNLKLTQKMFVVQAGQANSLINAGFTEQEIIDVIDYLRDNPPANGVSSLAYLQYCINDILPKIKVRKMTTIQREMFEPNEEDIKDNAEKFKNNSRNAMKGLSKF